MGLVHLVCLWGFLKAVKWLYFPHESLITREKKYLAFIYAVFFSFLAVLIHAKGFSPNVAILKFDIYTEEIAIQTAKKCASFSLSPQPYIYIYIAVTEASKNSVQ